MQTEEFVWHDLWGGWDIDSVHIVGDRMIAHSHDEVRIYQRVGRLTRLAKKLRGALLHLISPPYLRSIKQPLLVNVHTSSGYYYKPIVVCTTNE